MVSTTPGNTGNLLEFEMSPGNTGNVLEFNWCSWKICDIVNNNKLVGWHSDERWSELIITCSFTDISNFIYAFDSVACHIIVHVILNKLDQRKSLLELNVNMSWKSTGNLLGWISRHPVCLTQCIMSFQMQVFWGNQLHWYWQPNSEQRKCTKNSNR